MKNENFLLRRKNLNSDLNAYAIWIYLISIAIKTIDLVVVGLSLWLI